LNPTERLKLAGTTWSKMSDEEKAPFVKLSN
jgi:hypothetical protein